VLAVVTCFRSLRAVKGKFVSDLTGFPLSILGRGCRSTIFDHVLF
jgi:hypothetical protein